MTGTGGRPAGEAPDPYVGRTLDDRYLIQRLIGRGGMGAVYEARHVGLDRRVAVKFLLASGTDSDAVARFRREARAASKIDHEHVVTIFDVGTDGDLDFIAMEFVEGRDLRTIIREDGALPAPRALSITRQILDGLAAIHAAGIVHRDIKPGNVVVTTEHGVDHVKIMDFGVSKTHEPGLTAVGRVVGTPEYMAPEQAAGAATDHRADLYAVSLTLHAMLTGRSPGDDVTARQSPSNRRPTTITAGLSAVIERGLARLPEDRYADAHEFRAALTAPGESATVADRPAVRAPSHRSDASPTAMAPEPRRRSRMPLILAAVAVAVVGIGGWKLATHRSAEHATAPPPVASSDAAGADPAASARHAEREGKFELAIARYVETYENVHDPELLFRIGELYERLGRPEEAIRYYERYAATGPASGRDAATAKIAHLRPTRATPPVDAATPVDKSEVRPAGRPTPRATAHAAVTPAPTPAKHDCMCIIDDVKKFGRIWLCERRHASICKCVTREGDSLCRTPLVFCPGPSCPAGVAQMVDDGGVVFGCTDAGVHQYRIPASPGAQCRGYSRRDLDRDDPGAAAKAPEREGTYECTFCKADPDETVTETAKRASRSGTDGDACTGVRSVDGQTYAGHLECK